MRVRRRRKFPGKSFTFSGTGFDPRDICSIAISYLAIEEAKRTVGMSDAVMSLYRGKNETFYGHGDIH